MIVCVHMCTHIYMCWGPGGLGTQLRIRTTHIMEFRKMVTITLYARQKESHRCIEPPVGLYGRRRGWDDLREQH